jgi:hypothetical protein
MHEGILSLHALTCRRTPCENLASTHFLSHTHTCACARTHTDMVRHSGPILFSTTFFFSHLHKHRHARHSESGPPTIRSVLGSVSLSFSPSSLSVSPLPNTPFLSCSRSRCLFLSLSDSRSCARPLLLSLACAFSLPLSLSLSLPLPPFPPLSPSFVLSLSLSCVHA